MIHLTYMCHALHRVCEDIRTRVPDVGDLVNNTKKVFRKAPSRIAKFHEMCPDIPLPKKAVLTRWGTWIEASIYYCSHYDGVKEVIETFDPDEAGTVNSGTVKQSLALIKSNYSILPNSIKRLEGQGLKLMESLAILQEVKEELE